MKPIHSRKSSLKVREMEEAQKRMWIKEKSSVTENGHNSIRETSVGVC